MNLFYVFFNAKTLSIHSFCTYLASHLCCFAFVHLFYLLFFLFSYRNWKTTIDQNAKQCSIVIIGSSGVRPLYHTWFACLLACLFVYLFNVELKSPINLPILWFFGHLRIGNFVIWQNSIENQQKFYVCISCYQHRHMYATSVSLCLYVYLLNEWCSFVCLLYMTDSIILWFAFLGPFLVCLIFSSPIKIGQLIHAFIQPNKWQNLL